MHRRLNLLAAIVACGTALALTMPTVASASARPSTPSAGTIAGSVMNGHRHVFKIGPGKKFDVVATLHGVRRGDRLALESHYRRHRHHPKRWHVLGSWRLHRGEHHFRGRTYGSYPGLFTLRVQFLRHHRLLRGSQSNRFYVKVRRFHVHKLRKPHRHSGGISNIQISTWNDVRCGTFLGEASSVDVDPPISQIPNQTTPLDTYQVMWVRDALPGGNYGAWYEPAGSQLRETVQPPGSDPGNDIFSIGAGGETSNPTELSAMPQLDYATGQQEYHQVAWDMQILNGSQWQWVNPNDWYTPNSYQQYDAAGNASQSSTCFTSGQGG